MSKLVNWDFADQSLNSTTPQINRQKSAQNIEVIFLDPERKSGIFSDKRNPQVNTTLDNCDCKDFNFAGNSPRKKFAPCMHIYRLAMELNLFSNHNFDQKTRNAMLPPDERKENELKRIQSIESDLTQWGGWGSSIHNASQQTDRQHRSYGIFEGKDYEIIDNEHAIISGYRTTLASCSCADFEERRLPCKHIYCFALLRKILLHISYEQYAQEKERFEKNFVPLFTIIPYCVQDDFNISLFGPLYFIILQEVQTANGQNRKVYRTDC